MDAFAPFTEEELAVPLPGWSVHDVPRLLHEVKRLRSEVERLSAKKRLPSGAIAITYGPPASNPPDYGAGLAAGYAEGLRDGRRGR